jgi:hypothetical protein
MSRSATAAVLPAAIIAFTTVSSSATPISRDSLERRLLDTCIYRQFQVQDVNRSSMVDNCRCASRTALQWIEGDWFEQPESGGLTPHQDQAIRAGIDACFRG